MTRKKETREHEQWIREIIKEEIETKLPGLETWWKSWQSSQVGRKANKGYRSILVI